MPNQRAQQVARQAAGLLPEPPPAHDAFGYLAWEELVVSVARRLQPLLDDVVLRSAPPLPVVSPAVLRGHLDGDALLTLAVLLVQDDAGSACSELLSVAASA